MPDEAATQPVPDEPADDAATPGDAADTTTPEGTFASGAVATTEPWGNWLYTGPDGRIYTDIPWTSTAGGVLTWHTCPATDGAWTSTDEPVNTWPDNKQPEPDAEPADTPKEG